MGPSKTKKPGESSSGFFIMSPCYRKNIDGLVFAFEKHGAKIFEFVGIR
jgi:hypothetical protein